MRGSLQGQKANFDHHLKTVYLSIGTNFGDRKANIQKALAMIVERIDPIKDQSSLYISSSWGYKSSDFYNMVCRLLTSSEPREFLRKCQNIEREMGRVKESDVRSYTDRIIDIDILTFGDEVISEKGLIVPHPRASERNFVLQPWMELAAELVVPGLGRTVRTLMSECNDSTKCEVLIDV